MIAFGLTKGEKSRPTTVAVDELDVHDGKGGWTKVRVGEKVEVFNPDNNKGTVEYLGPGPFTIEWLAEWRCGMGFLQLRTPKNGGGKGVNSTKIVIAS